MAVMANHIHQKQQQPSDELSAELDNGSGRRMVALAARHSINMCGSGNANQEKEKCIRTGTSASNTMPPRKYVL